MRVLLLGSAAAEGWPALFCTCDACREAWRRGGRNIRRRTSYAVNTDTLVDFGPDGYWQSVRFGIDLSRIRHLLITHSHDDHFVPAELQWRREGFSRVSGTMCLYGNQQVLDRLAAEVPETASDLKLSLELMQPGRRISAANGLTLTALEAQHAGAHETALNYVIEDGRCAVLIANDTGWWPDTTWEQIREFRLDAAVLECTYGPNRPEVREGHLGAMATVAMRDRLAALGTLRSGCRVVANHFTHNGRVLHEELCEFFQPHGIEVGWDGLELRLQPASG